MADTNINSATVSDLTNTVTDYSVNSLTLDASQGDKEFWWVSENWNRNLGYYRKIPELKVAIDTKVKWTIGAGYEATEATEILLNTIKGNGKDSFNSILKNMVRIMLLDGDSYCEIIRDKDGLLINLKPLDPSSIRIVQNGKGVIKRYEQINKINNKALRKFDVDEIFHLSRERIGDEIHGVSVVDAVEWIILARNEAMSDWKRVLHRNISPLIIWHLDTDDQTEINTIKSKTDSATNLGENMYIPKGTVVPEVIATAQNATLSPLQWIAQLTDYFFQVVGVPQIVIGNAKEFTDASGKIVYLAFEQSVKDDQLYVEEQVLGQLNLEIALTFPASLQQDTVSDTTSEVEEEPQEPAAQPNDTVVEAEGKS